MYKTSIAVNNGWKSDYFNIVRGIKGVHYHHWYVISSQKYSHSKYEPVILIKKRIQNQYTQLADDTTLVYKIGKEIKEAIEIINELGTCSGLKLNIKKNRMAMAR